MDTTSLKIKTCNNTHCKIELCFDFAGIFVLRGLQADKLRYEINVTNNSKWETRLLYANATQKRSTNLMYHWIKYQVIRETYSALKSRYTDSNLGKRSLYYSDMWNWRIQNSSRTGYKHHVQYVSLECTFFSKYCFRDAHFSKYKTKYCLRDAHFSNNGQSCAKRRSFSR